MQWRPEVREDAYWVFLIFRVTTFVCVVPRITVYRAKERVLKHTDERAWIRQRLKRVLSRPVVKNGNGHGRTNGKWVLGKLVVPELTRQRFEAQSDSWHLCHSMTDASPVYPISRPDEF